MKKVFNFSAGPAALPAAVVKKAADELVDYKGLGYSIMEMSHRSAPYKKVIEEAEQDLRDLMGIPDNYKVLFLQGGASMQFAAIPLNLFSEKKQADFINTGTWSKKAIKEAARYGNVNVVASSEDKTFCYMPEIDPAKFNPDADYVHITTNNTIYGTMYKTLPDTGNVPLVADMSSNILSERIDVSKFGVIFAGAQKNIGPAGLAIVIVREDLIGRAMDITPTLLDWKTQVDAGSMFNTPPCFAIYMAGLVFKWLKENGGVEAMEKINHEKAAMLYKAIDESAMFHTTVNNPEHRSIMNVPFKTDSEELDAKFIEEATAAGLVQLKGHRSVGGMRASIYNAMPVEGVQALVDFIKEFERNNA